MNPVLSILIPSIPDRLSTAVGLYRRIEHVTKDYRVEILMLCDNKFRSIGQKRDELKNMATGDYFAFCDDDDKISDNYFLIAEAAEKNRVDIITFKQHAIIDSEEGWIDFDLNQTENEQFQPNTIIKRPPWHICAWKRKLVQHIPFKRNGKISNYGEDWDWCKRALEHIETQHKIDEVLHTYIYNQNATAAPKEL